MQTFGQKINCIHEIVESKIIKDVQYVWLNFFLWKFSCFKFKFEWYGILLYYIVLHFA